MCPHDLLGKFRRAHIKMFSPQPAPTMGIIKVLKNMDYFCLLPSEAKFSSFSIFRDLKIMSNNANHSCFKIAMGGLKLSFNLQDVDYGGP